VTRIYEQDLHGSFPTGSLKIRCRRTHVISIGYYRVFGHVHAALIVTLLKCHIKIVGKDNNHRAFAAAPQSWWIKVAELKHLI
jgi:hypothetical protein